MWRQCKQTAAILTSATNTFVQRLYIVESHKSLYNTRCGCESLYMIPCCEFESLCMIPCFEYYSLCMITCCKNKRVFLLYNVLSTRVLYGTLLRVLKSLYKSLLDVLESLYGTIVSTRVFLWYLEYLSLCMVPCFEY